MIAYRLKGEQMFSGNELNNIRKELLDIDLDIQHQCKLVTDDRIRPKMMEYDELQAMAERRLKRREARIEPAADELQRQADRASLIQFGDVNMSECLQGKRIDSSPELERQNSPSPVDYEPYASDNENPFPLHLMSTIKPARNFDPVAFSRDMERGPLSADTSTDLRTALDHRRSIRKYRDEQSSNGSRDQNENRAPNDSMKSYCESDTQSQISHRSYVSSKQETFSASVTGRAYPPVQRTLPHTISRKDPNIIGMSELYVHPHTQNVFICPVCQGNHKMYRCITMLRISPQERWYKALKAGVCLSCLIRGHSSFTCINVGACAQCKQRHNSILCPKNPYNY